MNIKKLLIIGFVFLTSAMQAQDPMPVKMEYFLDSDPGYGNGITISNVQIGSNQLTFDVSTAAPGPHVLSVRSQDAAGRWSQTISRTFFIDRLNGELNRIEYFFDTDPGYGNGFPLEDPKTGENTYLMSFESINEGVHVLCLRAQDDVGHWSQTMSRTIYAIKPVGEVVAVEYFFDKDPGEGKGEAVKLPTDLSAPFIFEVPIDNLSANVHQFCVRAMDSYGNWSILRKSEIEVIDLSGINGIGADGKFGDVYDLNGRKLTPEMISKGGKAKRIYIIDGRKFVK